METINLGADRVGPAEERSVRMPGGRLFTTRVAAERTGWAYSLFEVEVGRGGGEAPHIQHRGDEYIYVIEGRFGSLVEGVASEVGPGTDRYVPRGALHPYENTGEGTGRLLVLHTPGGSQESFLAAAGEPAGSPADHPDQDHRGAPCSRRSTASRYARQEGLRRGVSEMNRKKMVRYGGLAAILGGAMHVLAFVAVYLIYFAFAEEASGTFFGQHAFIHIIDVAMFTLLAVGATGVYLSQSGRFGRIAKSGFYLTLAGFGISVVGGLTIIAVGLAVSDEATLGVLDIITHPLAQLLYTLGSAIFGVALLRKGTLPKLGALLVAVGPPALFALFMTGNQQTVVPITASVVATGLGWAVLGHGIRGQERPTGTSLSIAEERLRPPNPAA